MLDILSAIDAGSNGREVFSQRTEKTQEGGLKGRVIWPRQGVTIRTIQRFCRGHLTIRVHAVYLLPGRLIPGQTCFFQMLV